jgi:histidine triad (HIT) family protein
MTTTPEGHCVFCKIVRGELPSTTVYEDDQTLCFMDINPATHGHCLAIPKVHRENIHDMSESECLDVMNTTKRVADAIRKTLNPDGSRPFRPFFIFICTSFPGITTIRSNSPGFPARETWM